MTLHLQDFKLTDVLHICERLPDAEREVHRRLSGVEYDAERTAAAVFLSHGIKFIAATQEGEPVAAAGFMHVGADENDHTFRTWFYATETAWTEHGGELTRITRQGISDLFKMTPVQRVETITLADQTLARSWYGKIGLQFESHLLGYGPFGDDAVMYVATRNSEGG